jgi:hypothetical protein
MGALRELVGSVPSLNGRVRSAGALSALMRTGGLLQASPAAFILPLGIRGSEPDAATGLFRQIVERLWGVLLVVRAADDQAGERATAELEPLIDGVIAAVVGAPDEPDGFGVFRLSRGELVGLQTGVLTYQLDFAIEDQLRIQR